MRSIVKENNFKYGIFLQQNERINTENTACFLGHINDANQMDFCVYQSHSL